MSELIDLGLISQHGLSLVEGEVQYDDDSTRSFHLVGRDGSIKAFIDLCDLPTGEVGIGQITVEPEFQRLGLASALFRLARHNVPELVLHGYDYTEAGRGWVDRMSGADLDAPPESVTNTRNLSP